MFNHKALCRGVAAALLISASTGLYAAQTTYNYTITGVVEVGDEVSPNAFDLTGNFGDPGGETITAFGTFTVDDSFATSGGTVSFEAGSGNTMTIDLNGTLLSASDALSYPAGAPTGPTLQFTSGWTLSEFFYDKLSSPTFYSSFTQFDDTDMLYGEWQTMASVTAVPEAETYAMMLAGLGLVGWMGVARRKSLQAVA
jgi:hypothetical protein